MSLIKLTINRQAKSLSASTNGDGSSGLLPPLYPDAQNFQIQVIDPPTNINSGNAVVDCSADSLRVIVATPDSINGIGPTFLLAATYDAGWAWDPTVSAFTGTLNLRTAEIESALGGGAEVDCVLEVNLSGKVILGAIDGRSNMIIYAKGDVGTPYVSVASALVGGALQIKDGVGGMTLVGNVLTVAGLALGVVPARYDVKVITPAGSGFIDANFIIGSGTADGFSAVLSAIPPNDNYFLIYIPIA